MELTFGYILFVSLSFFQRICVFIIVVYLCQSAVLVHQVAGGGGGVAAASNQGRVALLLPLLLLLLLLHFKFATWYFPLFLYLHLRKFEVWGDLQPRRFSSQHLSSSSLHFPNSCLYFCRNALLPLITNATLLALCMQQLEMHKNAKHSNPAKGQIMPQLPPSTFTLQLLRMYQVKRYLPTFQLLCKILLKYWIRPKKAGSLQKSETRRFTEFRNAPPVNCV